MKLFLLKQIFLEDVFFFLFIMKCKTSKGKYVKCYFVFLLFTFLLIWYFSSILVLIFWYSLWSNCLTQIPQSVIAMVQSNSTPKGTCWKEIHSKIWLRLNSLTNSNKLGGFHRLALFYFDILLSFSYHPFIYL